MPMNRVSPVIVFTLTWLSPAAALGADGAVLESVPFTAVRIDDAFWKPRVETVLEHTVPHCFAQCEQTGRLRNFDVAAGKRAGKFEGYFFNDSDVYKVLEGAAYALQHRRDPKLEAYVDEQIARIAAAQQEDGYLNTYFTLHPEEQRWENTRVRHELYCAGHLIEAAVAHHQATGKRALLDVAIRFADYIDRVFGPGKRVDVPGHEEIELALIKLYHLTGDEKYLNLAAFFIDQRGRPGGRDLYGEYCQDHAPVCDHTQIVGHAVRAMYLYCGVADLVALRPDDRLTAAMGRIWRDTVRTKMYITGGIGSSRHNEGFTRGYDLPNDTAYCETCAAIALCLWAHRLNLLHADGRYVDVLERALYNNVLAGISLEGTRFFYVNPLASDGDHHRQPWFACACCPSNAVRFLPSIGNYVYAHSKDAVYVNLYVGGEGKIELADGRTVVLRQQTRYPWDGAVRLTVEPVGEMSFGVKLRIPGWCQGATLAVNGQTLENAAPVKGYAAIRRAWHSGDVVELNLPMPVERMQADPRVEADRGRVALQRGPLVYCLEDADNPVDVRTIVLPPDIETAAAPHSRRRPGQLRVEHDPGLLGGVTVIRGAGLAADAAPVADWSGPLYRRVPPARAVSFTAIPYYAWDNRQPGAMVVWLPESLALTAPQPVAWLRPSASHCNPGGTLTALHDTREPGNSGDQQIPRFTWWPRRGTTEWVQYDFDRPRAVSGVAVYWFDDRDHGGECRVPVSWRLLYRDGGEWRPVEDASSFGVGRDGFNDATFEAVTTDGLRIETELQPEFSGGILEWKVGLAD